MIDDNAQFFHLPDFFFSHFTPFCSTSFTFHLVGKGLGRYSQCFLLNFS